MTREEAYNRIDAIIAKHEIDDVYVTITNFMDYDALRIARKTLEQEPCEDCITLRLEKGALKYSNKDYVVYKKEWLKKWWQPELALLGIELPSIQPKTKENLVVEDCISRAELLKAVDTWDKFGCDANNKLVRIKDCYVPYIRYDDVVKAIKGMPSIQPKTGHWIEEKSKVYKCSNCGSYALEWGGKLKMSRYCPNCGAKMLPTDSESEE